MADENGATGQDEAKEPPASPTGNPAANANPDQYPSAGTLKTEGKVPFHELMNDPEFQDYFNRQLDKRVKELTVNSSQKQDPEDVVGQIASELKEEFEMSDKQARKLAEIMNKVSSNVVTKNLGTVHKTVERISLSERVAGFQSTHPDLPNYADEMRKTFSRLSPQDQKFILESDTGIEFLYSKVKLSRPSSSGNPYDGTSPAGKSSASIKSGERASLTQKAVEAAKGGNRHEYERIMANLAQK